MTKLSIHAWTRYALATSAVGVALLAGMPGAGAQSTPAQSNPVPGPTTTATPTTTSPPRSTFHISGNLWLDLDGDGTVDPGEPAFAGVTVILTDDHLQIVATRTTDADGHYDFDGLVPGNYIVAVKEGVPTGATNTFDPDRNQDGAVAIAVSGDTTNQNFGYRGLGKICTTVERANRPLADTAILISGPNGVTIGATTDADGVSCTDGLFAGTWTVRPSDHHDVDGKRVELSGAERKDVTFSIPVAAKASTLAFTGGQVVSLVGIGIAFLVAGALLLARRKQAGPTARPITAAG